jgi:hypothetical protein
MGRANNTIKGVHFPMRNKVTILSKPGAAVRVKRIDLSKSTMNNLTAHVDRSSLPGPSVNSTLAKTAEASS